MILGAVTTIWATNLDGGRLLFEHELAAILRGHRNNLVTMRRMLSEQPHANAHLVDEIAAVERRIHELRVRAGLEPAVRREMTIEEEALRNVALRRLENDS